MSPFHSIGCCPVCGGGLCGIRICGVAPVVASPASSNTPAPQRGQDNDRIEPHGLIVCDECDAVWRQPDTATPHQYPDHENPRCPVCGDSLYHGHNHWARAAEIHFLGWSDAVDRNLDACDPSSSTDDPSGL